MEDLITALLERADWRDLRAEQRDRRAREREEAATARAELVADDEYRRQATVDRILSGQDRDAAAGDRADLIEALRAMATALEADMSDRLRDTLGRAASEVDRELAAKNRAAAQHDRQAAAADRAEAAGDREEAAGDLDRQHGLRPEPGGLG